MDDSRSRPKHRLVVAEWRPRKSDSRIPILPVRVFLERVRDIHVIWLPCIRLNEREKIVGYVVRIGRPGVAETQVDGEVLAGLPVVLDESDHIRLAKISCAVG